MGGATPTRRWLRKADVKPWQWQFRVPSVMQMSSYASVCCTRAACLWLCVVCVWVSEWIRCVCVSVYVSLCVCVWASEFVVSLCVCVCVCVSTPVYMQIFFFGRACFGFRFAFFRCSVACFISCIKLTSIKCVVCIFPVCLSVCLLVCPPSPHWLCSLLLHLSRP